MTLKYSHSPFLEVMKTVSALAALEVSEDTLLYTCIEQYKYDRCVVLFFFFLDIQRAEFYRETITP